VIGHEFSHILNGDIRLNVRLIGILAGIVSWEKRASHHQACRGGER
jgi:Zn-dependent protease with chaperone function